MCGSIGEPTSTWGGTEHTRRVRDQASHLEQRISKLPIFLGDNQAAPATWVKKQLTLRPQKLRKLKNSRQVSDINKIWCCKVVRECFVFLCTHTRSSHLCQTFRDLSAEEMMRGVGVHLSQRHLTALRGPSYDLEDPNNLSWLES